MLLEQRPSLHLQLPISILLGKNQPKQFFLAEKTMDLEISASRIFLAAKAMDLEILASRIEQIWTLNIVTPFKFKPKWFLNSAVKFSNWNSYINLGLSPLPRVHRGPRPIPTVLHGRCLPLRACLQGTPTWPLCPARAATRPQHPLSPPSHRAQPDCSTKCV